MHRTVHIKFEQRSLENVHKTLKSFGHIWSLYTVNALAYTNAVSMYFQLKTGSLLGF